MRGKYRIRVQNKRIRYDFEIKRNITIIKGDSATRKTTLVELIREYDENGPASGIELYCDKTCTVLYGKTWESQLDMIENSIVFIDEGSHFVTSNLFASKIQKSNNYYVIVTREGLHALPYSVEEVYGIRNSGKYEFLKQTYNEFYHFYGKGNIQKNIQPELVLTEDSNSGFQFFDSVYQKRGIPCMYAGGKSNIFTSVLQKGSKRILIIADGAAFGSEMDKFFHLTKERENIYLYLPESFEWLILQSGILQDKEIQKILEEPYDYIESRDYFSWERYFTDLLIKRTTDSYLKYSKHTLNIFYMQKEIAEKILKVMENINLE